MGRILTWTGRTVAYLFYGLAVALFLLWYLFPEKTVRRWLECRMGQMTPEMEWRFERIGFALPPAVALDNIRISSGRGQEQPLILDRLALFPDVAVLVRTRRPAARYRLQCCGGRVEGAWSLSGEGEIDCTGTVSNLHLEGLRPLFVDLNRQLDGILSGTFALHGEAQSLLQGKGRMNLVLSDGRMTFQAPVLGMNELPYSRITMQATLEDKAMRIEQGTVESKQLQANFSGSVELAVPWLNSQVRLEGAMQPRPEFFGTLGNPQGVELIRRQLKDGRLTFTVSGRLAEPGILFAGIPASLNTMLQGGRKQP